MTTQQVPRADQVQRDQSAPQQSQLSQQASQTQPSGQATPRKPGFAINRRLFALTKGVRGRIALAAVFGLATTVAGVARLSMQGTAVAMVFQGSALLDVLLVLLGVLALPFVRVVFTMAKEFTSHGTAAIMKVKLRALLYEHLLTLGPSYLHKRRTGEVLLNTVEAVEQLETYYGRYLPQLFVAGIAPIGIFIYMAVLDLPSALIFLFFAAITFFAPTFFRSATRAGSQSRRRAFAGFAADFVDSVQGLSTLKVFGQANARGEMLATKARDLYRATMKVLAVNIAAGGVANVCMALGAAVTLSWGAVRVANGELEIRPLLIVLFLGVEVFRPMRELNQLYHQGLLAMSSAMGMFDMLDDEPDVKAPLLSGPLPVISPTVTFENVSFAYESGKRPALDGVSFDLPAGKTLGLVGPSGAGKTTVVNLLFRFYDPSQGRILLGGHDLRELPLETLRDQIAVVAQDTYLFYGTVTDNLRLGKPDATDEELFAAAKAANAHEFIVNLKDGYDTIVGERGQKLSGGQRQRIAIARAILKDAPILILDEATSHVDSENESLIQEALERLMRERTTLVIAHRLSTVAGADQIVVLDRGKRVESGTHAELLAHGGVYANLVAMQLRAAQEAREEEAEAAADVAAMGAFANGGGSVLTTRAPGAANGASGHGAASGSAMNAVGVASNGAHAANGARAAGVAGTTGAHGATVAGESLRGKTYEKPIEAAEIGALETGLRLLGLVGPQRVQLSITLAGGVIAAGLSIAAGVSSASLASQVSTSGSAAGAALGLIPLVLALAVGHAVFTWFESWIAHDMAYKLLGEMRVAMYQKLNPLAPAYLLGRRSGDLTSIVTSDIETVESFFAHAIAPLFVAVLIPGIALTALAILCWPLALALLPFLVAVGLSPRYIGLHTERLGNRLRKQLGEVNAHVTDSVQGLREVVAFSRGKERLAEIVRNSRGLTSLQLQYGRQLGFQAGTIEGIQALGGLSVLAYGTYMVSQGSLDPPLLPIATMLAFTCFGPIAQIANVAKQLANAFGSGRRVFAVHDEPVVVRDGHEVAPGTPVPPSIRFEGVSFRYESAAPLALSDVSFSAEAGQTIALVGRSGAGKTTAAHLLMRFWDPQEGRILLGGHDLREFELDDLRTRCSLVSQDIYLFNMSIRENLRLANPAATDEEVEEAARRACAHDFILALPDGYDTIAGERGVALSGGQRQRLAIARALLKRAPLLILDEATSHLDTANERTVRLAIAELMQGSTTLVIAHRLSTVRDADHIVVLDAGRVAEQGTHDALVERGGVYAHLINAQLQVPSEGSAATAVAAPVSAAGAPAPA